MLSKDELDQLNEMGMDLGIPGEDVLGRDLHEIQAVMFIALWKRLKVVEAGFNLLADQRGPCRPAA